MLGAVFFFVGISRKRKKNGLTISGAIMSSLFGLLFLGIQSSGSSELSVSKTKPDIKDEVAGVYKFIYPAGQVEILSMKNDETYNQTIYLNESSQSNSSAPLYVNNGTWWKPGSGGLVLDNWLFYCELCQPDKILNNPHRDRIMNATWYITPEQKRLLSICAESNYIFEKIENQSGH